MIWKFNCDDSKFSEMKYNIDYDNILYSGCIVSENYIILCDAELLINYIDVGETMLLEHSNDDHDEIDYIYNVRETNYHVPYFDGSAKQLHEMAMDIINNNAAYDEFEILLVSVLGRITTLSDHIREHTTKLYKSFTI